MLCGWVEELAVGFSMRMGPSCWTQQEVVHYKMEFTRVTKAKKNTVIFETQTLDQVWRQNSFAHRLREQNRLRAEQARYAWSFAFPVVPKWNTRSDTSGRSAVR